LNTAPQLNTVVIAILIAVLILVAINTVLSIIVVTKISGTPMGAEKPGAVNTSPASSVFVEIERLEVVNAYAEPTGGGWKVIVVVKNTGTKSVTIDNMFINNRPYTSYLGVTANPDVARSPVTIRAGESMTITITITSGWFASGQTVSIVIHTASGGQYPATVTLP